MSPTFAPSIQPGSCWLIPFFLATLAFCWSSGPLFAEDPADTKPHTETHSADPAHAGEHHSDADHHAGKDQHAAGAHDEHHTAGEHHADGAHGGNDEPPAFFAVIPFMLLLGCIALFPLLHNTAHWWEHNSSKLMVSGGCAIVTLIYYALLYGHGVHDHGTHAVSSPGIGAMITVMKNALLIEYVPFIVLLFSLYTVSGGINITGSLKCTPFSNAMFLIIGSIMASFVGTTGAAMVLIRPLLKANARRELVSHTVVFFIFVVCNTGGCLLPIGDPPLFLGYLSGVPFFWTLSLLPHWAFMNGLIIVAYWVYDTLLYRRENPADMALTDENPEKFGIRGALNLLWMVGVILAVALLDPTKPVPGTSFTAPAYLREGVMLVLVGLSLVTTPKVAREANSFNYDAILEVAALFVGIFICMQPAIQLLKVHGSALGIDLPWKYYWATGVLSSFLDNAPTYMVFFETAKTVKATSPIVEGVGIGVVELMAISLGAVFMGSMTYIGNGPNFMVKAIAEKSGVKMPSFFGYMVYSMAVVFPTSILLTLVFFTKWA